MELWVLLTVHVVLSQIYHQVTTHRQNFIKLTCDQLGSNLNCRIQAIMTAYAKEAALNDYADISLYRVHTET